jgi:hypothetical protein
MGNYPVRYQGLYSVAGGMPAARYAYKEPFLNRNLHEVISSGLRKFAPTRTDMVMRSVLAPMLLVPALLAIARKAPELLVPAFGPGVTKSMSEWNSNLPTSLAALTTMLGAHTEFAPAGKKILSSKAWNNPKWVKEYMGPASASQTPSLPSPPRMAPYMQKKGSALADYVNAAPWAANNMPAQTYDAALDMPLTPELWRRPALGIGGLRHSIWKLPEATPTQKNFLTAAVDFATNNSPRGLTSYDSLTKGTVQAGATFGGMARTTATAAAAGLIARGLGAAAGMGGGTLDLATTGGTVYGIYRGLKNMKVF